MKTNKLLFGFLCFSALCGFTSSSDAYFEVQFLAGNTHLTQQLTGFGTEGHMMAGMNLTAYFDNGIVENSTWESIGAPAGRAESNVNGLGWSLDVSGDTWGAHWFLRNDTGMKMSKLVIDAGPGDTIFDTTFGNTVGTVGSALGRDFEAFNHQSLNITATYFGEVALTDGGTPVGDLFRYLELDFNPSGFASGQVLEYVSDTDNIQFAGDLNPVPEPGTLILLSIGLIGISIYARRRNS